MAVLSRFQAFARKYPVVRGMLSYACIWPMSSLLQQTISGKDYTNYDYMKCLRFSIYGCFFTAPTLFCWIKISTHILPGTSLKTAITKAFVEQLSYGPAAMACFFFGMTLLEGKGYHAAADQVEEKLLPAYKVGVFFWPVLQTINFFYIKERNRVAFTSACSLVWTCFLAYMHQLKDLKANELIPQESESNQQSIQSSQAMTA